jgi:serine/threonine protein kinase HipA of HipAB toxin-antitoxin module
MKMQIAALERMTPLFDFPKSRAEMECLQIQTNIKRAARGSLLRAGEA